MLRDGGTQTRTSAYCDVKDCACLGLAGHRALRQGRQSEFMKILASIELAKRIEPYSLTNYLNLSCRFKLIRFLPSDLYGLPKSCLDLEPYSNFRFL